MPRQQLELISQAMSKAGAPCLHTVSSQPLGPAGFYVEENRLNAAEIPPVTSTKASAGMVVSSDPLQWNWRQSGREYQTLFHPENILTSPGGQFPQQWWLEPVSILTVYFEPEFLSRSSPDADSDRVPELRLSPAGTDPVISHLFWAMRHEMTAGWPNGRIVAESIATALAAAICRRFATSPPQLEDRRGGLSRKVLVTVTDFIRTNPGHDLSLLDLAKLAGIVNFTSHGNLKSAPAKPSMNTCCTPASR